MTMRKIKNLLIAIFVIGFMSSCSNRDHFISDATQRAEVEKDLQEKMAQLPNGDLFNVLNLEMPQKEKEALQFLYAYMPLSDITDYPGSFYHKNILASYTAKEEMPWVKASLRENLTTSSFLLESTTKTLTHQDSCSITS